MTSQNFPIEDPRIPKIIEQRLEGATWEQTAQSVGLTRRAVYDIRQKDEFRYILDTLAPQVDKKLEEYMNHEQVTVSLEACKEVYRMRRALMTRRSTHTEDITLTHNLNITETRKQKAELVDALELSPDQYKVLEDSVTEKSS